ncbi:MAG: LuxR C-terminal-related transcriptional regulator, partial [Chloroflexota bacterium]
AALCNAMTERNDSQLTLEALEAENLFTIALDDTREWFRYHHLFADYLRKQLTAEYPEAVISGLHQRASHWLAEHGFIIEAIDHALGAKDYKEAARLVAPQCEQWIRHGETSMILKYLDQLPKELVWTEWDLCLWYGWAYGVQGDLDRCAKWTNRLETLLTPLIQNVTLQENGSIPPSLQNAYAQLLAIRSLVARQVRDYASALALGEQALQLVPADNSNLRTIVSALLSSATLEAGRFDQAESLLNSARQMAYRVGNPFITFTMLLNESALAVMRGQLQRAYDLNLEALRLTQTESMERLAFLARFRLGRVHYFWNQLAQAKEYINLALEQADVNEYPTPTVRGYITLAWIQNAEGQFKQAMQTLNHAERIAMNHRKLEPAEWVRGVRAQFQLSVGEVEAAGRWAKSSDWGAVFSSKSSLLLSDESFFSYCQILIASQDPIEWQRLERLLAWRLKDSEVQRRDSAILKIHLMQALLHQARNQPDLIMASLLQALELAMPENVIRPFLEEGRLLIPLLRRVSHKHAATKFARKILAGISNLDLEQQSLLEPLSEQELNILKLMAQGHTNPAIARQLFLAVSTVRWYAKQIFRKLGVHNRTQAASEARKLNLI